MTRPNLDTWLNELVARFGLEGGPGVVIGAARGEDLLCRQGFGLAHIEIPAPMTATTLLPIASITKQMTALCALLLERDGLLDLAAPIGAYLPELPARAHAPTLRQLLSHLSGLRCHLDVELFSGFTAPRPDGFGMETLKRLNSVNANPGAWQVYGNAGFHLVSHAIERTCGATFAEVMKERVFSPLDMSSAQVAKSAAFVTPGLASLYTRAEHGAWSNQSHLRVQSLGEGGVCANLDDMLVWARALRTEDPRIEPSLWRALKTPVQLADGTWSNYGLGLSVANWRGVKMIGHSGLIIGQSSTLLCLPEFDLDIVVLANTTLPTDLIARELIERVIGVEALASVPPPARASDYAALIGKIFESTDLCVGFGENNGGLTLSLQGVEGVPLQVDTTTGALTLTTNLGPLHLFLPDRDQGASVDIAFGGETHHAQIQDTLTTQANAELLTAAIGTFACPDLDSTIAITRDDDGRFRATTRGPYGSYTGELTALTPRVLRVRTPHLGYLLRLTWEGAAVSGLGFDTLRTRNLFFHRKS